MYIKLWAKDNRGNKDSIIECFTIENHDAFFEAASAFAYDFIDEYEPDFESLGAAPLDIEEAVQDYEEEVECGWEYATEEEFNNQYKI